MPTTTKYLLPYPAATDPADVPADMQRLAQAVEDGGPGAELVYAQIVADVTVPAGSTVAVVSAGAHTYQAVPIVIEFYAAAIVSPSGAGASVIVNLYADGVDAGRLAQMSNQSGVQILSPIYVARRLTPTAGSHTYEIRATAAGAAGTVAASGPNWSPAFIRVSRA